MFPALAETDLAVAPSAVNAIPNTRINIRDVTVMSFVPKKFLRRLSVQRLKGTPPARTSLISSKNDSESIIFRNDPPTLDLRDFCHFESASGSSYGVVGANIVFSEENRTCFILLF